MNENCGQKKVERDSLISSYESSMCPRVVQVTIRLSERSGSAVQTGIIPTVSRWQTGRVTC